MGKETLRKALYDRCGEEAADASVLTAPLSLSPERVSAVRKELMEPPKKLLKKVCPRRLGSRIAG